jgi:hypothetical protein
MKYYRINNNELIELSEHEVKAGDLVYNSLGKCCRKIYIEDNIYFIEVVDSVLNEGETVSTLTPRQIQLFCSLSRSKMKKYYANKDQDQR